MPNAGAKRIKAGLIKIFSSYQGEGPFVGVKQIFIRFAGCNLKCHFCDTPKGVILKNVSVTRVMKKVKELKKGRGRHYSVSLTGGEPLLHVEFLEYLLPKLKRENFEIYLETNGTLSEELKRVIAYVDIVAMDLKLPSSAKMEPLWPKHAEFLKIAGKKKVFTKAVVTKDTLNSDIVKAAGLVKEFDKNTLLVLQPASRVRRRSFGVTKKKLLNYLNLAEEKLNNVRVIPQVHKIMGIE